MGLSKDERLKWLDKALEGETAEVKARVLGIILRYDVDPRNEFFMIFVAFGYLVTLVEDAPSEWRDLFTDFQSGLSTWTDKNLQTLEQLAHQSQTIKALAESSNALSSSSTKFLNHSMELMQPLQECNQTFSNLIEQLKSSNKEASRDLSWNLESSLTAVREKQAGMSYQIESESKRLRNENQKNRSLLIGALILSGSSLLICGLTLVAVFVNQKGIEANQQQLMQKTEWLLKKANRWECQQGIKAPDSVECQSLNE